MLRGGITVSSTAVVGASEGSSGGHPSLNMGRGAWVAHECSGRGTWLLHLLRADHAFDAVVRRTPAFGAQLTTNAIVDSLDAMHGYRMTGM